jgi:hypothetical protein
MGGVGGVFVVFVPKTPEKPSAVKLIMIDNKKIMQNFFIKIKTSVIEHGSY